MSEEKKVETCGGYCCEKFHFANNEKPEDIQRVASRSRDNAFIADMVIYLGESKSDIEGGVGQMLHWYTCKHFDTVTRLCKVYEQRPEMCRSYNTKWWSPCGLASCKMPKPERPAFDGTETLLKLPGELPKLEFKEVVPADGVEPSLPACHAGVLPMDEAGEKYEE